MLDPDTVSPPAGQLYLERWDSTTLATDSSKYAQGGDQVVVFDTQHPYPDGAYETATIQANPAPAFADVPTNAGGTKSVLVVYLDHSLSNTYVPSPMTFDSGDCAAVGVIHSADGLIYDTDPNQLNGPGSAFYDADMRDIEQPFDDAYVEFFAPRSGMGAVPYIDDTVPFYDAGISGGTESNNRMNFEVIWGKNEAGTNYIYLLGCKGRPFTGDRLTTGITDHSSLHYSYIYIDSLETWGAYSGENFTEAQMIQAEQSDTDHELGHEFSTNACTDLPDCTDPQNKPKQGEHDDRNWWEYDNPPTTGCPPPHPCLMYPFLENPPTGINYFCNEDLFLGDPNCSASPPNPRQGAIRTATDPLP
ncbi:MAG: hypothetical protein WBS54_10145 [Acidobacteriota bacterium]